MKKLVFFSLISFNILAQTPGTGVTDIDANQYATVIIGTQEWMAENLRTTKYANGDVIPNVTDPNQWYSILSGAWCHYQNNTQYEIPFGKLYNWYVVGDSRKVCPTGWHVPTDTEWTILEDYLGPDAGAKMKSIDTQFVIFQPIWNNPSIYATNESGFSALPGGNRDIESPDNYAYFEGIPYSGGWWSSTFDTGICYYMRRLTDFESSLGRYGQWKYKGLSIRYLKGAIADIETIELSEKTLLKITDILGRETEFVPNTVQISLF